MAIRAKLSAPRDEQQVWRWHEVKWTAISSSVLQRGDRRMEGDSYLLGGYGIRLAFESQRGAARISDFASVWQPSRLKGIQLTKEYGTPFLAATQVFDLRPSPRKFLSLDRTTDSSDRFIKSGTIVITCSGTVGRSTLMYAAHDGVLISHDLLRIQPRDDGHWGWLYAFLRSTQGRAMMGAAQYGHMIKHLEPSHVYAIPIPVPRDDILAEFQKDVEKVLAFRNRAWELQVEAEQLFAESVGVIPAVEDCAGNGFSVATSELFGGRRRFEAAFHSPVAAAIMDRFRETGLRVDRLSDITDGVWWLTRFKRVFGEDGIRYLSADELFSINPPTTKRVLVEQAVNPEAYRVKAGWIVMACSGQTYGLNGSVSLMTKKHEEAFFSHDLIRILPKDGEIRSGYLFTALGHPLLGRPLVIRNAYGTSIPHLDPEDVAAIPIVRLLAAIETRIADVMEEAIELRVQADELEDDLTGRATHLNDLFLSGDTVSFNVTF